MRAVRKYMVRHQLGVPEQSVLVTPLEPEEGDVATCLVWSESGLHLVSARNRDQGMARRLSEATSSFKQQDDGDARLRFGGQTFSIEAKYCHEVRLMFHRAKLREQRRAERDFPDRIRHVESPSLAARIWLSSTLDDEEDLLAWLAGDSEPLTAEKPEASVHLLLTSQRTSLVILSTSGDGEQHALAETPLRVEKVSSRWSPLARYEVRSGDVVWTPTRGNVSLYQELAPIVGLPLGPRLLELARCNWHQRDTAYAVSLLTRAMEAGERHAAVVANLCSRGTDVSFPELGPILLELAEDEPDSARLAALGESWELDFRSQNDLLHELLALEELPRAWAAALYRQVHAQALEKEKDGARKTEWSLAFCQYLVSNDLCEEAIEFLETWLESRPSAGVRAVLPPRPGTGLPEELSLQIRVLELLEQAQVRQGTSNQAVVLRLARLRPTSRESLGHLEERAEGRARERMATVLGFFAPGGLALEDQPETSDSAASSALSALDKTLIDDTLQHEAAREGSAWGRLQGMLAKAEVPDFGVLRSFCERLPKASGLHRAASDASHVLGTPVPEIFISRGDQTAGLRAFEAKPPFILIGSEHLDAESPMYLAPSETRFGIASELAHLRYKHTRATAAEVRKGALDKGLSVLDFAVSLVPAVASATKLASGSRMAEKVTTSLKKVHMDTIVEVSEKAGLVQGLTKKLRGSTPKKREADDFISMPNDQVIEAHRVMQLTADRSGLVLCGDLGFAIRFMFLSCPAYYKELELLERVGLAAVFEKRDDAGALLYEDLAIRIGNLLAFYLSDDYLDLRGAAGFEAR